MYQHIFFDLDHTLWDFERNSREALSELFQDFQLVSLAPGLSLEDFLAVYYEVNEELWRLYNQGQIDQLELRHTRFQIVLSKLGVPKEKIPYRDLAEAYLEITPRKGYLVPYTLEVLEYLKDKYPLHIITNGFADVQDIKLDSSGLSSYFDWVVTSANAGYKKPDKRIFDFALEKTRSQAQDCLMIGDNLETDILGARLSGIDHVFFNPKKNTHTEDIQIEIDCLSQLMNIL